MYVALTVCTFRQHAGLTSLVSNTLSDISRSRSCVFDPFRSSSSTFPPQTGSECPSKRSAAHIFYSGNLNQNGCPDHRSTFWLSAVFPRYFTVADSYYIASSFYLDFHRMQEDYCPSHSAYSTHRKASVARLSSFSIL